MECSDIDDIIVFRSNGTCVVTKVQEKVFVGRDIIYCSVFKKNDDRKVYNVVYLDGKSGTSYVKRFKVTSVTRDREYKVSSDNAKSKITYFSANENGEAEVIQISLTANCTAKIKQFDYDFAKLAIKGRESLGNMLTKYPVRKITMKSAGVSTLGGVDIWYDPTIGRLNRDGHGDHIGNFEPNDSILAIYASGNYELTNFELTNRYPAEEIMYLKKFEPQSIISAAYFDGSNKTHLIKRFHLETTSLDKKFLFISDHKASKLIAVTDNFAPNVQIKHKPDGKTNELEIIPIDELAEVRGWKALGSKLNYPKLVEVVFLETEEEAPVTEKTPDAPEPVEIEEVEEVVETIEAQEEVLETVSDEPEAPAEVISDEPEFVINFPEETKEEEKPPVEEKKEDEIPFEIKNPPKGEQLGLF
jgi:topoisomerase-4 subunit A